MSTVDRVLPWRRHHETAASSELTPLLAATWLKAGVGSGVIGSFTTLSAVMGSLAILAREGQTASAFVYLGVSLVAGLGLAAAGLKVGSSLAHRPMPTEVTDDGATL
jgi:CrcB protein